MSQKKIYLIWFFRILIFVLFMLSAIAKLVPVWAFEKQLVDLQLFDWCQAPYVARLIIAVEIAIGIAILQNHLIKRLVIPATILLLVAFCIHLSMQIAQFGAMNGNCGCFGQLIPMTPLEALIKNILTIIILLYLFKNVTEKRPGKWWVPFLLFLLSLVAVFLLFPFKSCAEQEKEQAAIVEEPQETDSIETVQQADTLPVPQQPLTTQSKPVQQDTVVPEKKAPQPSPAHSRFSKFNVFETKKVNLDKGKKIVCMFAAGCDHCRETAKTICGMAQNKGFPDVYILFMDEETFLIDEFFKVAGCRFPHQVVDIPQFWNLLGTGKTTPGVFYLWNGNIIKSFDGIDNNKFKAEELQTALQKQGEN
jgi:hypothetical protein